MTCLSPCSDDLVSFTPSIYFAEEYAEEAENEPSAVEDS